MTAASTPREVIAELMDRREAAARAAYTYWASRGGTLSASRLRDVTGWESIPSQDQWYAFIDAILAAADEAD